MYMVRHEAVSDQFADILVFAKDQTFAENIEVCFTFKYLCPFNDGCCDKVWITGIVPSVS